MTAQTNLEKWEKDYSPSTIQKQSKRAVTLSDVWNSTEVSFKSIETNGSVSLIKKVLTIEIFRMVHILKADMQDAHVEYMVDYIMQHYYFYTISDITCLTDRLVKNNPYGKPILQNLIFELDQYSTEKDEYAVEQRIKENSLHKVDILTEDRFHKMYMDLKKKAKEPVITQKEKDRIAIKENKKKIEEMKKLYPENE